MNEVYVLVKVINKPEFKFLYRNKKISKCKIKIELKNKSIVDAVGYDNMADFIYQNIKENDVIFIEGKLNENMEIEVMKIYVF